MVSTVNGVVVVMPPPEGYVVDFDNPERNSVLANYYAAGIGMGVAFLFLAQRIYVRICIRHSLGVDDCMCCIIATLSTQLLIWS
jgi:hypothetical protein